MKAAMDSRPSVVSLNVWLCENNEVHIARFSKSSDHHCFHTARLSGVVSVAAVFTLHNGSAIAGYTRHDFTIGRIADNSVWSANYSQTHTRSDKVIMQDHADIMIL